MRSTGDQRRQNTENLSDCKEAGVAALAYGNLLQTILDFIIIAFAIFIVIKLMNAAKRKQDEAPATPPAPPEDIVLLREIRDALKKS